jgi:hypothetical protein
VGNAAGPLMKGGAALGVAGMAPRQIRSHLDTLEAEFRAGRITADQLGDARAAMGLPRQSGFRPVSAAQLDANAQALRQAGANLRQNTQRQVALNARSLAEMQQASSLSPAQQLTAPATTTQGPARDFMMRRVEQAVRQSNPAALQIATRDGTMDRLVDLHLRQLFPQLTPNHAARIRDQVLDRLQTPHDLFESVAHKDPIARAIYDRDIAPHFANQAAFTDKYFAGAFTPAIEARSSSLGGIGFSGKLIAPNGNTLGEIERIIDPSSKTAMHDWLKIEPGQRGGGFVKEMTKNQFEVYQAIGIQKVKLLANIDVGGYAWAKYGFLPDAKEWDLLKAHVGRRLADLERGQLIDPESSAAARLILQSPDPYHTWALSNLNDPFDPRGWTYVSKHGRIYQADPAIDTVGKALLVGSSWHGDFNLANPRQMERFQGYVGR